jgi:hypothetical protein
MAARRLPPATASAAKSWLSGVVGCANAPLVIAAASFTFSGVNHKRRAIAPLAEDMYQDSNRPERPRLEPEIIPPARGRRGSDWQPDIWPPYASAAGTTHRLYVARLGPVGLALLMLLIGIIVAVITLAVVGAILIWIPILALLLGAGVVFRLLRHNRG